MTRINTIPVDMLTDQHLVSEYRELPRIFSQARPLDPREVVSAYRMGPGHIKFFYDKLLFLSRRHERLVDECLDRKFNVALKSRLEPIPGLDMDWVPQRIDHHTNLTRLHTRLMAKPEFYRHRGRPVEPMFYRVLGFNPSTST